ncbi:MAG: hypothetical protein ACRDGQ_06740 [Candidatus Limnocylindrales bacterium]
MSGDVPVMSGAWDATIVGILAQVSDMIDEEIRNVRGQRPGWSILAAQAYGLALVSVSGPASGTFTLTSGASTTVAIATTATAATVGAALDTILGVGNSLVTGPPGGPWRVTYAGTLSGAQPELVPTSTITPATSHAIVENLIPGTSATVTRRYSALSGGPSVVLIDDAVAVSAVSILDPAGNLVQTLAAGSDYLPFPLNGLPITGLMLTNGGAWPGYPGGVSVVLTPGFATSIPPNINRIALQEAIRNLRGAQAGEDDRLGMTPFGTVVVSKALLASTLLVCQNYRYGAGFLRG